MSKITKELPRLRSAGGGIFTNKLSRLSPIFQHSLLYREPPSGEPSLPSYAATSVSEDTSAESYRVFGRSRECKSDGARPPKNLEAISAPQTVSQPRLADSQISMKELSGLTQDVTALTSNITRSIACLTQGEAPYVGQQAVATRRHAVHAVATDSGTNVSTTYLLEAHCADLRALRSELRVADNSLAHHLESIKIGLSTSLQDACAEEQEEKLPANRATVEDMITTWKGLRVEYQVNRSGDETTALKLEVQRLKELVEIYRGANGRWKDRCDELYANQMGRWTDREERSILDSLDV